jgi:hypothetical protein
VSDVDLIGAIPMGRKEIDRHKVDELKPFGGGGPLTFASLPAGLFPGMLFTNPD